MIGKKIQLVIFKKARDPLFYIALILACFWIADTWEKIFILHSPARILWWSSMGLGLTVIGLVTRNIFLITSMFCMLFVTESLWTLSFLSNLFFRNDNFLFAQYAFGEKFPAWAFLITLFHLLIIPSLIFALIKLKRVSSYGWAGAYVFGLLVAYLAYFFPDQREDINCVRGEIAGCKLYLQHLYFLPVGYRIFFAASFQLILFYIPLNMLLIILQRGKSKVLLKLYREYSNFIQHVYRNKPRLRPIDTLSKMLAREGEATVSSLSTKPKRIKNSRKKE